MLLDKLSPRGQSYAFGQRLVRGSPHTGGQGGVKRATQEAGPTLERGGGRGEQARPRMAARKIPYKNFAKLVIDLRLVVIFVANFIAMAVMVVAITLLAMLVVVVITSGLAAMAFYVLGYAVMAIRELMNDMVEDEARDR